MARLVIIRADDTYCHGMLAALKSYASIPDDSQDKMLLGLLRKAALRVQEYADRPFLVTECQVTATVPEATGVVRLYMGGGEVTGCTDAAGEFVPFDPLPGGRLLVYRRGIPVTVTYRTQPTEGDQQALYHTVIRHATADYDGADTQELNRILSEGRQ